MKDNEIEERITSMLENVLNDDSDDSNEIGKNKNSCIKNMNAPLILLNNQHLENSIPKRENIPNNNLNKLSILPTLKKNLTFESIPQTNNFNINMDLKHPFSNKELNKLNDIPQKVRPRKHYEKNSNVDEIEDLLEEKIKLMEKIEKEDLLILKGNFHKLIISQNGSRILQKALQNSHSSIMLAIFSEIDDKISDLMIDPYANYFCQIFYTYLEINEKLIFLKKIKDQIEEISNSKIGTYPLQAIIDNFRTRDEQLIIQEAILDKFLKLSIDPQGAHVVEKMIICFSEESIKDIYSSILDNFITLANNSNGLCIVKKMITYVKKEETIKLIQKKIIDNIQILIINSYGNYSIQTILEIWNNEDSEPIVNQLYNNFHSLSLHKYSSNVVEKCLEKGGDFVLTKFIEEICHKSKLLDLMKNSFGNYVVQKALKLSTGFLKVKLTNNIKKNIEKLNDKKLVNKWKSILTNCTSSNLSIGMNKFNHGGNSPTYSSGYESGNSPNNSFNSYNSFHSQGSNPSTSFSPMRFTQMVGQIPNMKYNSKSQNNSPKIMMIPINYSVPDYKVKLNRINPNVGNYYN